MDFKYAFKMQQQLDDHINENKGLSGFDVMQERRVALFVELGELANATRCFKFWSEKPSDEREKILDELVDCKHFLLSIGNYSGFSFDFNAHNVEFNDQLEGSLTDLFLKFYIKIADFYDHPSPGRYVELWDSFFSVANKLNFSQQEIYKGFILKNEINYQRQAEGY